MSYIEDAPVLIAPYSGKIHTVSVRPNKREWSRLLALAVPRTHGEHPIRTVGDRFPRPAQYGWPERLHFVWLGENSLVSAATAVRRVCSLNPLLVGASPYHLWWGLTQLPMLPVQLSAMCKSCDGGVGIVAAAEAAGEVAGVWCPGDGGERRAKLYPAGNAWPDQTVFAFAELY